MIRYLDLDKNTARKPNENFARELFELFTLGEGHYTEADIKEAAKAFTGHRVRERYEFVFQRRLHDSGLKTVFSETGTWDGDEVIDITFRQPAARTFLIRELIKFYLTDEEVPDPSGVHIGDIIPQSFLAERSHSVFGMKPWGRVGKGKDPAEEAYEKLLQAEHIAGNASYLQHTMMNTLVTERRVEKIISGYKPKSDYPGNKLAQSLKRVAALIHADLETRVYFVSQGGYDTHAGQKWKHARLLGSAPDLNLGQNKDLKYSTDFRSVYSSVLDQWLEADAKKVLGQEYEPVPFV